MTLCAAQMRNEFFGVKSSMEILYSKEGLRHSCKISCSEYWTTNFEITNPNYHDFFYQFEKVLEFFFVY